MKRQQVHLATRDERFFDKLRTTVSGKPRMTVILLPEWLEKVLQAVYFDFVERRKEDADAALWKALLVEPDQVGFGEVAEDAAFVLAKGHPLGHQFGQDPAVDGRSVHQEVTTALLTSGMRSSMGKRSLVTAMNPLLWAKAIWGSPAIREKSTGVPS